MSIVYYNGSKVDFAKTAVALGTFDGLHAAHMKIINTVKEYATLNNIACGVHTFTEIPANVMGKSGCTRLISNNDKIKLLSGVDFIYEETFDEKFYSMSPEEFVAYLKNTLNAEAVAAGYNYRFGRNAKGDINTLKSLCSKHSIKVFAVDKTDMDGDRVSSSRIRKLISEGNVKKAARLLNRPYFISGTVEKGFQNGRQMGFPTANLSYKSDMTVPKTGVYMGFCLVDEKRKRAVINVGNNPTFKGTKTKIECHLLDFDEYVYDKEMTVEFIDYIREEICFSSKELLMEQIQKDVNITEKELKNYE